MAIIHTNKNDKEITTTYNGMVVAAGREDVQIMSDVWEMWSYGLVYDVVTDKTTKIYGKAEVDASPELMKLYKESLTRSNRHMEAMKKWGLHNRTIEDAHTLNLSVKEFKKLKRTYEGRMYDGCWDLLKVKKFRNSFRESLAMQLRNWLSEKENKYPFPFSRKQTEFVMPYSRW
jgi:hypothetical protein